MVMPVLKCPYLAQYTLQQVRASATNILNSGAQSCPIFGQFARTISTTGVSNTTALNLSSPPIHFDELKVAHERYIERNVLNKGTMPTAFHKATSPYGDSKNINELIWFVFELYFS